MTKGFMKTSDNNIHAFISTKPFYKKFQGMIKINSDVLIIQETEKALLIRERILPDDHALGKMSCFSTHPFWIPKSKIIKKLQKE